MSDKFTFTNTSKKSDGNHLFRKTTVCGIGKTDEERMCFLEQCLKDGWNMNFDWIRQNKKTIRQIIDEQIEQTNK